jgi:hypothetical protein
MADPTKQKPQHDLRQFTNVTRAVKRLALPPAVLTTLRCLIGTPYTIGVPRASLLARVQAEHRTPASQFTEHLAQLAQEGLVRVDVNQRPKALVPWVWLIPVEGWPEKHFLTGLALRLGDEIGALPCKS